MTRQVGNQPSKDSIYQMLHLNGGLLCAVAINTTGPRPGYHELIELTILPLNNKIQPCEALEPFICYIKPEEPERAIKSLHEQIGALHIHDASYMFEQWYSNVVEQNNFKSIYPLGFRYDAMIMPFLREWLGYSLHDPAESHYDKYFNERSRDPAAASLYVNDIAHFNQVDFPFPKYGFKQLARRTSATSTISSGTIQAALTTAEMYRRMRSMILSTVGFNWSQTGEWQYAYNISNSDTSSYGLCSNDDSSGDDREGG